MLFSIVVGLKSNSEFDAEMPFLYVAVRGKKLLNGRERQLSGCGLNGDADRSEKENLGSRRKK